MSELREPTQEYFIQTAKSWCEMLVPTIVDLVKAGALPEDEIPGAVIAAVAGACSSSWNQGAKAALQHIREKIDKHQHT